MSAIALILLIFLISLSLIMFASIWYMRFMLEKIFGEKHRDIDAITSSGMIPERWSRKNNLRLIQLHQSGNEKAIQRMQQAAARSYLRKLRRLTAYVKRTNLVENEEARKAILRTLQQLYREWSEEGTNGSVIAGA
ncbi:hypothetical protein [Paenibacillus sp. OV219]|uniref:hypothetical protein n=1 Tax=Paenibacillus sp. OV219 TaxID=1884377 RepID=UPI0008C70795|nr:hypothetical protein [Paenibacillus sp. OV219]SEN95271.1 hypothetical protein SAMN05518847_10546 [Paenibacillus sp. OV219]